MPNYTQGGFGALINTEEIADEAITFDKLATSALNAVSSPIGSVVAFLKTLTGTPSLPSGWVECNGQTISDAESVYNGVVIPNLNASGGGTQRFLRGATTSGTTGGSETHTHTQNNSGNPANEGALTGNHFATNETATSATSTLPSYYGVVWILRIK